MASDLSLAQRFQGRPTDETSTDGATLGAALRRLFHEGERAWPGLELSLEAFVEHLAARGAGHVPPETHAADLYLACACATQARGAIEAFDRTQLAHLRAYLVRLGPTPAFVDEVRQELREKLFVSRDGSPPRIAVYDGRAALASWVRVVALRTAIDLRRQGQAAARREPGGEEPATAHPEVDYLKRRYRQAFDEALRGAFAALDREQRRLLRLHFADGLTLEELAAQRSVHRTTVARRLAAARDAVKAGTRSRLQAALGATDSELDSLTGVLQGEIDLSMRGLLRSG